MHATEKNVTDEKMELQKMKMPLKCNQLSEKIFTSNKNRSCIPKSTYLR